MMLPSRLGCPLSLKTPNMGNVGEYTTHHEGIAPLDNTTDGQTVA